MKIHIWVFLENPPRRIQVWLKSEKNNGYFTWRPAYIYDECSLNAILAQLNSYQFGVCTTNELKTVTTTNNNHKQQNAKLKPVLSKHFENIKTETQFYKYIFFYLFISLCLSQTHPFSLCLSRSHTRTHTTVHLTYATIAYSERHVAELFLERKMFETKFVEKVKTHILCSVTFLEIRAFYEIMRQNMLEPDRPQIAI